MKLNQFLNERPEKKSVRYRTLNIDDDLHFFFKQTANLYNVTLSDLVFNILSKWKEEYQEEIRKDQLKKLKK